MPGGKLEKLNADYTPEYNIMSTGNWITGFTFTKKVALDASTNAKDIARLVQAFLAHALPRVEVFGITGSLYGQHPPAPSGTASTQTNDVEFTFRVLEGRFSKPVEYRGVLQNPLKNKVAKGSGTEPKGVLYKAGQQIHSSIQASPDADAEPHHDERPASRGSDSDNNPPQPGHKRKAGPSNQPPPKRPTGSPSRSAK
ncbi:hypothetical protein BDP27DRAFT_1424425 [Rhodocollybia butyracea]|uniref:Uncharacterized protein n=1 Tax=Rhodocollybia butyracea TaxID=206335 RepID=A0A9P5PM40_9AGAR|nr:hypothetical protein BDP27DRAFT_1424425 [Rhodocollybia butyracea]